MNPALLVDPEEVHVPHETPFEDEGAPAEDDKDD